MCPTTWTMSKGKREPRTWKCHIPINLDMTPSEIRKSKLKFEIYNFDFF